MPSMPSLPSIASTTRTLTEPDLNNYFCMNLWISESVPHLYLYIGIWYLALESKMRRICRQTSLTYRWLILSISYYYICFSKDYKWVLKKCFSIFKILEAYYNFCWIRSKIRYFSNRTWIESQRHGDQRLFAYCSLTARRALTPPVIFTVRSVSIREEKVMHRFY